MPGLVGGEGGGGTRMLDALCFPWDLYPIPLRSCPEVSSPLSTPFQEDHSQDRGPFSNFF